jgi:hypothetical protein
MDSGEKSMSQKPKRIEAQGEGVEVQPQTRQPYAKPAIIHELELETRAGSPLQPPPIDPLDPLGLGLPPKE